MSIKGPFRKRDGCAMKVAGLTRGDLHGCPRMPARLVRGVVRDGGSARASLAVEKSAEAVLPAGSLIAGKGRTRSRASRRLCSWIVALIAANPFGVWPGGSEGEARGCPARAQHDPGAGRHRRSPRRGELVGAVLGPRESRRGAQTRRAERRCPRHRRDEHQGATAVALQPLAGGPLAARGGHLPAAARPQGDDPQALGRPADAGGAGCGGSVDLPGHRAGAHAHLRPAVPSP